MSGVVFDKIGVLNLLNNCLKVQPGDRILLVSENPDLGWYCDAAAPLVLETIADLGLEATHVQVGGPDEAYPAGYSQLLDDHDTIIYLARIGDQERFFGNLARKNIAMLYARDATALASPYTATNHLAMTDLKLAIDKTCLSAKRITITCPLGTDLECGIVQDDYQSCADVVVQRFPLCVPRPILANKMSGKVALARWLTPTSSQHYSPSSCKFDSTVFAMIEQGKINGFVGEPKCVEAIEQHYDCVSTKLCIDKNAVHSWHAGIHPACFYQGNIDDDPDRWSNNVFGNPRFLHFHTCGNYAPGEICWMVLDPTISVDGAPLWENGRLMVDNFPDTTAMMKHWPELKCLFDNPSQRLGIDATDLAKRPLDARF